MTNKFRALNGTQRWGLLVDAALRAAEEKGMSLTRRPGRGKSNVWIWDRGGKPELVSIRTSQDRAFAFPPLDGGTRWKTLDDVQHVLVAVLDDIDDPKAVEVYLFDQKEVRARFDLNYKTRIEAGQTIPDDYGNWIAMDKDERDLAQAAGSGIAADFPAFARFRLADLMHDIAIPDAAANEAGGSAVSAGAADPEPATVGGTISWARGHIAKLANVPLDSVKLDLRIEYC